MTAEGPTSSGAPPPTEALASGTWLLGAAPAVLPTPTPEPQGEQRKEGCHQGNVSFGQINTISSSCEVSLPPFLRDFNH